MLGCVRTLTGTRPSAGVSRLPGGLVPVSSYCPRSSLPATVLAWLATPPGPPGPAAPTWTGRHPAAAAGGPPGRGRGGAAGRSVQPPRWPGGRHLQDRGRRQPGPAARPLGSVGVLPARRQLHRHPRPASACWLGEMARAGEAVLVDGLGTRVQRPRGWANQKVLYDAKRHTHTAQGLVPVDHLGRPAVGRWRLAGQLPRAGVADAVGAGGGAGRGRGGKPAGPRLPRAGQGA